jgi:hypothetical protein
MNEIPETIPCVKESLGSSEGRRDVTNMRTPVSTPGRDTGREKALGTGVTIRPVADPEDTNGSYALPYMVGVKAEGQPRL